MNKKKRHHTWVKTGIHIWFIYKYVALSLSVQCLLAENIHRNTFNSRCLETWSDVGQL